MKYFISCNNPVKINTRRGITLVGCGHCTQCLQAKADKTTLLLDLESQSHKYVEFLTLTYNDEFCPFIDFSGLRSKIGISSCSSSPLYHIQRAAPAFLDSFPIHFGDRKVRKFNPKTHEYYLVHDSKCCSSSSLFPVSLDFLNDVELYNKRVNEYYKRFPNRTRGFCSQENHVRILWYGDITRYLDRLRQYVRKEFSSSVRYYAVGEYGSQSLRPHWHILLFHDSFELHRSFEQTIVLPCSTESNPRECSSKLYLAKIWLYGDTTTKTTDSNMSSYVAGYLNQHSVFPRVLAKFPQRSFHSIFLGDNRSSELLSSLLKDGDFESLTTLAVTSRDGKQRDVSAPSSSYSRFNIRLAGVETKDYRTAFELLYSAKHAALADSIDIYDDSECRALMLSVVAGRVHTSPALHNYVSSVCYSHYKDTNSVNSFKLLLYGVRKLYKMSNLLGLSPYQFLQYSSRFLSWLEYQRLIRQFQLLEKDWNFAYQYYSIFKFGSIDVDLMKQTQLFRKQVVDSNIKFDSNVKHRSVVDSYKNV